MFTAVHLKGSIALLGFIYRLLEMFSGAKAISITAGLQSRLPGLLPMEVVGGEVLRLPWESINEVVFMRSKQIHLLAQEKGANYG